MQILSVRGEQNEQRLAFGKQVSKQHTQAEENQHKTIVNKIQNADTKPQSSSSSEIPITQPPR